MEDNLFISIGQVYLIYAETAKKYIFISQIILLISLEINYI